MLTVVMVGIRMVKSADLHISDHWLDFSRWAFCAFLGLASAAYVLNNLALWPEPAIPLDLDGLALTQSDNESPLVWAPSEESAVELGEIPPELYPERMDSPEPFVIVITGLPVESYKQPSIPDAAPKAALNLITPSIPDEEKSKIQSPAPPPAVAAADPKPQPKLIPVNGVKHKIRKGENLWDISQEYGVNYKKVVMYNPTINPKRMLPGDEIFIPGAKTSFLPPNRTPSSSMILPIANAKLGSGFGWRKHPIGGSVRFHHGIDLPAPEGTPIRAALEGVVIYADWRGKSMGLVVVIKHDDGLETVYAHCRKIHVRTGQRVDQGHLIAEVGRTGYTTGSHLHFEVLRNKQNQDPLKYLPRIGLSPESQLVQRSAK